MSEQNMITLTIDGNEVTVPAGSTIMDAATKLGIEIPRFCYHKRLSIAGNCRMCLVEVIGGPAKPTASCAFPVMPNMEVRTDTPMVKNARKGAMEFLLINHPLDCPICDQAGECDLQDISVSYGSDCSKYDEPKRAVEDKDIGPKIKTVMTRCIHCTRCIRFSEEIGGIEEMGAVFRGENMKVGTYVEHTLQSELAGNMIDLCPVGALTSKPYAFVGRPWEMKTTESIDVMDAVGTNINVHHRASKVMRIVPRENEAVNEEWLSDAGRFSYDGLTSNRLVSPMVKDAKGKLRTTSWKKAFEAITAKLKGKKEIAGISGDIHCAEDLFAFNAFMKQTLGTDNVDGRGGVTLTADTRSSYLFNTTIEGIDKADAILIVGANPRHESPILNARIRKAVIKRNAKVAVIGKTADLTYPVLQLGDSPADVEAMQKMAHKFTKIMKKASNPMIIIGAQTVLTRADADALYQVLENIAHDTGVIKNNWNGFNLLHGKTSGVASIDMHVYPESKGMDLKAISKACKAKKVDTLFIHGESENLKPEDFSGAKFTVFVGTHEGEWANMADVVLPAATYTEKDGLWTNTEGRVQEGKAAVGAPLNAKEDWKIFRAISGELGHALPFDSQTELRERIANIRDAYEASNIGEVLSYDWMSPKLSGKKLAKTAFENPVKEYYLTNEILRASSVMQKCQESTTSKNELLKKVG